MDVRCPRCGEPWDNDSIHDEVEARQERGQQADYASVAAEFRRSGCVAFREAFGAARCERRPGMEPISVVYDLLGDDMDGAAAMLEDAEAMGLLD